MGTRDPYRAAARIVEDAGGELVGRTRLQKIAFLLNLAGFDDEFSFEYRHYGPFSEELAQAMEIATALGPVTEEEKTADWGGKYSIYSIDPVSSHESQERSMFVKAAKGVNAIELELAATAAYLFKYEGFHGEGQDDPWQETRRRKPSKASDGRLEKAASEYAKLRNLVSPVPLPELPIEVGSY